MVRRLGKFQKKHKKATSYDITTTTYKKNTLKILQQMKMLFTEKHIVRMNLSKFTKHRKQWCLPNTDIRPSLNETKDVNGKSWLLENYD